MAYYWVILIIMKIKKRRIHVEFTGGLLRIVHRDLKPDPWLTWNPVCCGFQGPLFLMLGTGSCGTTWEF